MGIEKFAAWTVVPLSVFTLSKALVGGMFRYGPSAYVRDGKISIPVNRIKSKILFNGMIKNFMVD